jgi:hypothetical protein
MLNESVNFDGSNKRVEVVLFLKCRGIRGIRKFVFIFEIVGKCEN